jgi:hypothetical protein
MPRAEVEVAVREVAEEVVAAAGPEQAAVGREVVAVGREVVAAAREVAVRAEGVAVLAVTMPLLPRMPRFYVSSCAALRRYALRRTISRS